MLFCAFVGTALAQVTELSQLSNDKIYAIKSGRCFLLYSEANAGKLSTSTATAITDADRVEDAINNSNQQFKIQKTGENYYLYSVGAGKYLAKDGSLSDEAVDALEIHDVRANFPNYPWKLCIGGNGLNTQIANQAATGIIINSWTTADAGNTFQIVDIEEKPLLDALNELSTLVNNAKQELSNKHKVALQTTDANAPFYLSATVQGDAPISAAIDNNPATYYGSTWGSTVGHHHYWQVDLADAANLEEFTFSYITRANGKDTPTKINDQGSTDGVTFTDIVVLTEELPTAGGVTFNSATIANNGYRYIRFEVPSTTTNFSAAGNAEQEVTISIAEFSLIDANLNNYSVSDKNKLNAISAAEEVLNADNNTLKTVQDAIDALNAAMVSGQCTVSYSFIYNGVEKYSQEVNTYVGEEWPAVTIALPYGVSADKPEGTIVAGDVAEGVATKTIELTVNLPFVAAADYASINNWYYIQMHSSAGYSKYIQAVEGYIEWADAEVNANEIDTYTWGFIGNPFDGFKLVNYANGNTKGVNANASANPVINPAMDDIATATAWTLKPSTTNPTAQYFCFQYPGSNQYMNAQSGKIAFWGSADQGSTMWVTERDLSGATELQAVIDQVEAFVAAGVAKGTTVGYLTSESVANVTTALTAAKEAVARKTGCIEAQADLQAAVAAVKTIQPEEGKFYKIVSSCTKDHRAGQEVYVNNDGNMHFAKSDEHGLGIASAMSRVWQFVPAADGKFYIKNVERGLFMQSVGTASETDVTKAKAVTISNLGKDNIVSIKPDGQNLMHAQDNGSKIVAWNAYGTDDASAWVITEVSIEDFAREVTVGEAGYSTLVLGYNAVIPTGVEVYTVSATEDGSATLTMIEGNVLAAGEAVVLKNAGTYDFKYTTAEATEVENLLKGTTVNANIAEASYVLGNIDGVGFYTATFNVNTDTSNDIVEGEGESAVTTPVNDAFKNNAFKAYLPKTNNAAQTLRFNFGETTGIEGVIENTNANAVIFDLSGRRVAKMQKGIYIVNGKKVYVK